MQFDIRKKENTNIHKYPTQDMKLSSEISMKLKKELGDFLVSVVMFGSAARKHTSKASDIDILLIADDISFKLTPELVSAYTIIVEKLIAQTSLRFHVTSMTWTSFWDYVRVGDAVVTNILRDGVALIDRGFFEPMQELLKQGRVRPSTEAVWRYFGRAPRTLLNSRRHILQATVDLYWAVIDSAHAALMKHEKIPPSPDHAAQMLHETFVKKRKISPDYVKTMKKFFTLNKKITHREIKTISGGEYDRLLKEAQRFVLKMRELVE